MTDEVEKPESPAAPEPDETMPERDQTSPVPEETSPEPSPAPEPEVASGPVVATPDAVAAIEALLYASGKPAPIDKLAEAAELDVEMAEAAVVALEAIVNVEGRGIRLERVGGGIRIVSRIEYDYPIRRLLGLDGKTKLTIAALETLSIIAYRQPVTAPEIAELRGVNSASSVRTLLDRKLITTAGRKEVVGMPFLYKTTKEFLVHFGLSDLKELPKPEELEALYGIETPPPPEPAQTELFPSDEPAASEELPGSSDEAHVSTGPAPADPVDEPVAGERAEQATPAAEPTESEG